MKVTWGWTSARRLHVLLCSGQASTRTLKTLLADVLRATCFVQASESLTPQPVPLYAYQKVGADIFTLHGNDYLLVVDYFSKFPEYVQLTSKSAACIIQHLKDIFARHGIPETLMADNNPFNSFAMRQFAETWGFQIVTSSPRYPKSNGQAERFVQTIKQLMRKAVESKQDVAIALLQYRN